MPEENNPIEEIGLRMCFPHSPGEEFPDDLIAIRNEFLALADDESRTKHLYAATGLALYAAQCFEVELQQIVLVVGKAKGKLASIKAFEEADADLNKKTLGRLLKEVHKVVKFDENGMTLLELALEKRNSLAHGFFQEYSLEFPIKSGKLLMLDDLLERIALFRKADWFAGIVTKMMLDQIGLTKEILDKAMARTRAEMEAKDRTRLCGGAYSGESNLG